MGGVSVASSSISLKIAITFGFSSLEKKFVGAKNLTSILVSRERERESFLCFVLAFYRVSWVYPQF